VLIQLGKRITSGKHTKILFVHKFTLNFMKKNLKQIVFEINLATEYQSHYINNLAKKLKCAKYKLEDM